MDFLNKAFRQIAELFQSMTPAARITSALLLAVVVISLVYLVRLQTTGAGEYLLGGREFSQSDLANMEAAFGKAGLSDYEVEGYRVRVPRGQKAVYVAALADGNALPQDFTRHLDKALASNSIFSSSRHLLEQKLKSAKEKNLSLIISEMKGIDYARVQFEKEERHGLRGSQETRAVAAVKPEANNHLDEERIVAIRNTVVAGVAGLKPENVTVTDLNAGAAYPGSRGSAVLGVPDSPYAAHKRFHENEYRKKILEMLRDYPGIVVGVNVELDETLTHEETSTKYEQPVAVSTVESTKTSATHSTEEGGRPGAFANSGSSNRSAVVSQGQGAESTLDETTTQQQSVPGGTTIKLTKTGLLPKRVYASIGVPSSYYRKVWRERHPAADGQKPQEPDPAVLNHIEQETKKKIQDMIVTLLPKRNPGEDPYERVTVVTIDKLPAEPVAKPSAAETAATWLAGNWQTLGMILVGLFSLVMLRSMIRSAAADQPQPAQPAVQRQGLPETAAEEQVDQQRPEDAESTLTLRFGASGPNLRSELAQLVKEDPETAASVLRNWIGDAA